MSCRLRNREQARRLTPEAEASFVYIHGRLSSPRWHHPPFITGVGVGPCHLLSSLSTRPQRREEEPRRGGRGGSRRKCILVKLKQHVRRCCLLPHQICHVFKHHKLFEHPTLRSGLSDRWGGGGGCSLVYSSSSHAVSCLTVNLIKGGETIWFVRWNPGGVAHSTSLLSSTLHICLCGGLHLVHSEPSRRAHPSTTLPPPPHQYSPTPAKCWEQLVLH